VLGVILDPPLPKLALFRLLNKLPPPGIIEAVKAKSKTRHAAKPPASGAARRPKPKRAKRPPRPPEETPLERAPDLPYWIPRAAGWNVLSVATQRAVSEIIIPAYRQLVLEARGEVERSVGITLVHLMWLEICAQIPMAPAVSDKWAAMAMAEDPDVLITRHLHLVAAKCQTAELLSKVRMVGEMLRRGAAATPAAPYLPAPQAGPVVTVPAQLTSPPAAVSWLPAPVEATQNIGKSQEC
jgi:hypothetical protein